LDTGLYLNLDGQRLAQNIKYGEYQMKKEFVALTPRRKGSTRSYAKKRVEYILYKDRVRVREDPRITRLRRQAGRGALCRDTLLRRINLTWLKDANSLSMISNMLNRT
jgi:hypothetical protein